MKLSKIEYMFKEEIYKCFEKNNSLFDCKALVENRIWTVSVM